ncbi:hypothetical protein [Allohahella sp. A8]|uniref:hypothetical protein n=1 Tax=Allohahella sp. A8 TaxID=3141461 RepID=UPI003A7F7886
MAISKQQFRLLIFAEILLAVATGFATYWQGSLVEKVQVYADSLGTLPSPDSFVVLMGTTVLLSVLSIIAITGLMLFRNWARWLYVIILALTFPLTFYLTPVNVEGPFETIFLSMGEMLAGAIVALMFFSPVSRFFQREASTNYQ